MSVGDPRDLVRGTTKDLDEFLTLRLPESEVLDYKLDFGLDIPATVAAMANGDGGTLVIGVGEDRKSKAAWTVGGLAAADPKGQLTSLLVTRLEPVPHVSPAVFDLGGKTVLVAVVSPSTHRIILDREKGILVRVGDQSRPPSRTDLERLILRERARETTVSERLAAVEGAAANWGGPGATGAWLRIIVNVVPVKALTVVPTERLDETLATTATSVLGSGFRAHAHPDISEARRADAEGERPDRIEVRADGRFEIEYCVRGPGWGLSGEPQNVIDATRLALDILRCLEVAFELAACGAAELLPGAAAVAFSGWGDKVLSFPRFPRLLPPTAPSPSAQWSPVTSAVLAEPSDAFELVKGAVRRLARFFGQAGADAWAESLADDLEQTSELTARDRLAMGRHRAKADG